VTYDYSQIFKQVESMLNRKPGCPLFEIAKKLGIERHNIERAVKSELSIKFHEFKKRIRLERAIHLLKEGRSVREISLALGYGSPRAFSRFFKNQTGRAPGLFLS
jgi:transcriptional regulator GlxA family with amidase domain